MTEPFEASTPVRAERVGAGPAQRRWARMPIILSRAKDVLLAHGSNLTEPEPGAAP